MDGMEDHCPLSVAAYPVAWRVELVDDEAYRGFEYIRYELEAAQWTGITHLHCISESTGEPRRERGI